MTAVEVSNSTDPYSRMAAMVRCCCHLDPESLSEDQFLKEYSRAKYFLEVAHQVKFS